MATWQQILALDARYNPHRASNDPSFRTLYIRRRSQLLREAVSDESDPSFRRQYLRLRSLLLTQKYGISPEQMSTKSRSVSIQSHSRKHSDVEVAKRGLDSPTVGSSRLPTTAPAGLVPSARAPASQAIVGGGSLGDNYAFAGFLHVFDQHKQAVSCVRFAHDELALLAFGSLDARISVCDLNSENKVRHLLEGHADGVTGLEWSAANDLLVSCSGDATARLWSTGDGRCLRVATDPQSSPLACVVFHPVNNNFVIVGNGAGLVQVLNISTGHWPAGGSSQLAGSVTALATPATGSLFWAGCQKGVVVSLRCDQSTGRLVKCRRLSLMDGVSVTCISARSWVSRETADMSVLVNLAANALLLFRVADRDGGLALKRRFAVRHTKHIIKSCFCPIMSFRQGACVVSGSEDGTVCLFDVEREVRSCVNRLQGHSAAVLDVSFNRDESLLATSDAAGTVIVWKRQT